MRAYDHDPQESALRPKAARPDFHAPAPMMQAAASGHPEVLDGQAVLGLQRAVGNRGVSSAIEDDRSPVLDVVNSGGGSPLSPDVKAEMQTRLGHDFSDVRVHTDSKASDSAASVNAHAYTVGSNVVFQRDKYDPSSAAGKTMLAHELTHVIQQRSGPVDGTSTGGGIKLSDPSDRYEREAASNADRVMAGPAPAPTQMSTASAAGVQRHLDDEETQRDTDDQATQRADEEEEEAQGSFVQREEEEEEAQGSFVQREEEEEEAQGSFVQGDFVQRAENEEEENAE
jgi:Domain of unknown function (DUF4157)